MSNYSYIFKSNSSLNQHTPQVPQQDLSLAEQLDQITKSKNQLLVQEGQLLEKAFQSHDPQVIIKANKHWEDVSKRQVSQLKSHLLDPNDWANGQGYRNKLSLSYGTLRRMSKTPIIKAIIGTRQTQVSAFSSPQKNKYETGFVIRKKGDYYSDVEDELSSEDKAKIKEITSFILNGGVVENSWHGDNFDSFLKKLVNDSLTLDQGCFEVVRNVGGVPQEYLATDGATFRIADSYDDDRYENTNGRAKINGYYPSYVQVIDGSVKAEYYPWELCFGVRNATTDIRSNGYGVSEVEELINIITWMLFADAYNGKFFSQGSSPKGMLKVSSGVNRGRLAEFRQQWLSMVAGVQNAWKMPVLEADKMEYIDLQKNNTDMQFAQWQEYLIKVACAIFKIAPEEVGFNLGNASGGGALFEGSNEAKLKYSRDKGLKPLLKSIQFWINKWIVNAIDSNYEFAFVGIDVDSEEKEVELLNKKVQHGLGVKEWRRAMNLPEDFEEGDFPLNAVYAQQMQQQMFADQQEESTEALEEEDVWSDLQSDEDVMKGLENSPLSQHIDNPLMLDALQTLFINDENDSK